MLKHMFVFVHNIDFSKVAVAVTHWNLSEWQTICVDRDWSGLQSFVLNQIRPLHPWYQRYKPKSVPTTPTHFTQVGKLDVCLWLKLVCNNYGLPTSGVVVLLCLASIYILQSGHNVDGQHTWIITQTSTHAQNKKQLFLQQHLSKHVMSK